MAELVFAQEFLVALGDKAALALHGADKPELLQVGVGALGGDDAHAKIARECTDAGEFGSRSERARKDLSFDLRGYLLIDGLVARIGQDDVHSGSLAVGLHVYITGKHSIYTLCTVMQEVNTDWAGYPGPN